jgi:hypothetical protein
LKHLGILVFILHYIIALITILALLSREFLLELPLVSEGEFAERTTARLLLDFGFFLTLGLSTHWSVYRADLRVRKLFLLLSAAVFVLYILN